LLGWTWHQQFRFDEAQQLADDAMQEVSVGQTEETVRLLTVRAMSTMYATDTTAAPHADAERAVRLARAAHNRPLELQALQVLASVRTEAGLATPSDWAEVERIARREGRWIGMSEALYFQALLLLDDYAADAFAPIERSAEIAEVHGLTESLVWTHYLQAEAGFVSGDWDRAWSAGLQGISLGERHAYHRTLSRIWFVLLPIAVARGANETIAQAFDWWERRRAHFPNPPSPYGQLMLAAADLYFAEAGLLLPFVPGVASRLAAFDLDHRMPSWLAAVETITGCWLAAQDFNGVREALARMRRRVIRPNASSLSRGTEFLLRAELLIAEGASPTDATGAARLALVRFRRSRAPWWVARTIRLLESSGSATRTDLQEARRLERMLQLAAGRR
jgi:hypothetical protein